MSPQSPPLPGEGYTPVEFTLLAAAVILSAMPPTLRGCITVQRVRILSASHRLPFAFFQTVTQQPADQKHPQYHCRPSEQETLSGRPSSTTSCVVDRTGRTARVASTVNSVYRAFVSADDSHSTSDVGEKLVQPI